MTGMTRAGVPQRCVISISFSRICNRFVKQGLNQWIRVQFRNSVTPSELRLTFQGGFSTRVIRLQFFSEETQVCEQVIHPEDTHSCQVFPLNCPTACNQIRVVFEEACDLFGRIIVYSFDLLGPRSSLNDA